LVEVIGFRPAERLLVPTAVLGEVVEYLLPIRLSGLSFAVPEEATHSAIAPEFAGTACVLTGEWMFEASRTAGIDSFDALRNTAALATLRRGRLSTDLLCRAHARALGARPATLRDSIAWVNGSSPGLARLVPPPSSALNSLLDDLFAFIARRDIPLWIRRALSYFQFIHIHPFSDGNGRMSRLLMASMAGPRGIDSAAALIVAAALSFHRKTFIHAFAAVQQGDTSDYFARWNRLEQYGQRYALTLSQQEAALREELATAMDSPASVSRLFGVLSIKTKLASSDLAKALSWSARNAPRNIERLEACGWVERASADSLVSRRLLCIRAEMMRTISDETAAILA